MAKKNESKGAVRVFAMEICNIADDYKATRKRWHGLAERVRHLTNLYYQTWLVWHVENGSPEKIKTYLNDLAAWREAETQGDKPKLDVVCVPKELSKKIYATIATECTDVNSRVQVLVENIIANKLKTRKAANGKLAGWMSILLAHESLPSCTKSQPIPFDKANCELLAPLTPAGNWRLAMRIDRIDRGERTATSHTDECELLTTGRRALSAQSICEAIASGRHKFCGSSLQWNGKKWMALIAYQREIARDVATGNGVAVLRPAYNRPWQIRIAGRTIRLGGDGLYIGNIRRQLLTQRWSRQANYRHAGSATKGRGRNRALLAIEQLQQRWKDFVRTCNHNITKRVIDLCVEHGVTRLVYVQPEESFRDSRFLSVAGKVPGRHDASGWDWFQVGSQAKYKGQEAGVMVEIVKHGTAVEVE